MFRTAAAVGVLCLLQGCASWNESEDARQPVARVYEKQLYLEEISNEIPRGISSEDSALIARSLIRKWIEKELLLYQAESNLTAEKKDVEEQLNEYRSDLLIYTYQSELIRQKLDTTILPEEIETYYHNNQQNFELKDYIVRVNYVKTEPNAPQLDKVKRWLRSSSPEDRTRLEDYGYQFASNFYLDDDSWLYLDDFLKEVPIEVYNKETFLRSRKWVEFSDSNYVYLVLIKDYRLKNSLSPLSLERANIRNILLNKRKRTFIEELRTDLFEEAERKNNFEIYSQP